MSVPLAAVDWHALLDVIIAAAVSGIGLTLAFSVAIVGATRCADMRRDGRVPEAVMFAALMALGLAISAAGVVLGIIEMTAK